MAVRFHGRLFSSNHQAAHAKAEAKLQEELATLSRFDNELKALEKVIKEHKAAISQTDLDIQKLEHSIQVLGKERTAAMNHVTNLEKQFEWILQDKECADSPCLIKISGNDISTGSLAGQVHSMTSARPTLASCGKR